MFLSFGLGLTHDGVKTLQTMNRTVDEGCPGTGGVAGPAEGTAAVPSTGTVFCGQETPACFLGVG